MKSGLRQSLLSMTIFVIVLGGLVCIDARVRDRFANVVWGGHDMVPLDARVADFGGALVSALRYQSIENAPLLVFATVGLVLFVFMVRT